MNIKVKSYRLKKDSKIQKTAVAGTIVYDLLGYDYGLSSDDTHYTNIEHKSVTFKENGDYPFFTIPVRDLEEIE